MTEIRAFRGWHYRGDVSALIAPPYDILSAADKQALLAKSPDNIVAVDLPHVPPKEVGPDEEYQAAAAKLRQLQEAGVLVRDARPALYAYAQTYTWAGREYTRRALMCGVRATPFYQAIWPHEHTFAGPKADRLRLTERTGTQLSPIFGFYEDTGGVSGMVWSAVGDAAPVAQGELNGVREQLWTVTDPEVIVRVATSMVDRPIFIADGHHRYTTAMNYAASLREAGKIDHMHETNFVLFALVAMDDPGLIILPTHRLISGLPDGYTCQDLQAATAEAVEWRRVPLDRRIQQDADAFLKPFGPHAMAFLDRRLDAIHVGRLRDLGAVRRLAPDQTDTWRGLDVAILHRFFLEEHLGRQAGELQVGYTAHGDEAVEALRSGDAQLVAMLQGTPLADVRAIALDRAVMPHKSTYFYPKLATGMVLKPLG